MPSSIFGNCLAFVFQLLGSPHLALFVCFLVFETGSHVAEGDLKLATWQSLATPCTLEQILRAALGSEQDGAESIAFSGTPVPHGHPEYQAAHWL